MKKICFVTTVSITLKAFILDMAQYLHNNGDFEITFVCSPDLEFEKTLPEYIRFYPIPMKRGISLEGIRVIGQLFRFFRKEKFDMVQYSTPNASFYCSVAAFVARIKVRLYCQWGMVFTGFTGFKRVVFRGFEALVCRLSTFVEPDSYGNLRLCHQEGFYDERKSRVIWNGSASGVDLTRFDISKRNSYREELQNKFGFQDAFVFGFVGRVDKDKGLNELLYAFKCFVSQYPAAKLVIVGPVDKPESLDKDLYTWSRKNDNILYTGKTDEVMKYLALFDIFILPSYREGFGSVVIEAEAMGCPVIVTDIPGPTDAMKDNKTGLVVKKADKKDLLNKMLILYENLEMRKDFSKNAVEYVKDNFEQQMLFLKILHDREKLLG